MLNTRVERDSSVCVFVWREREREGEREREKGPKSYRERERKGELHSLLETCNDTRILTKAQT